LLWASVVEQFQPVIDAIGEMANQWRKVFALLEESDITVGDVIKWLGGIWLGLQLIKFVGPKAILGALWGSLKLVAGWGAKAAIAIGGTAAAAGIKAGFVGALSKVWVLLSGPVGVLALLAVFLGLQVAKKYDTNAEAVDGFGQSLVGLGGLLRTANQNFAGFVLELSLELSGLDNNQKALVRETVTDWDLWEKAVVGGLNGAHEKLDELALALGTWLTDSAADIETWSLDAIEDVGEFFTDFDEKVIDFLKGGAQDLTDFFTNLAEDVSVALATALANVTEKWDLLTAAVDRFIQMMRNIFIPSDLHESESPFARTLRHIKEGYDAATLSALAFADTNSQLSVPLPLAQQTSLANGSGNQFTIGPNTISNGMDEAVFAARVRRIVAEEVR